MHTMNTIKTYTNESNEKQTRGALMQELVQELGERQRRLQERQQCLQEEIKAGRRKMWNLNLLAKAIAAGLAALDEHEHDMLS